MEIRRLLRQSGWRQAAVVNTALVGCLTVILAILVAVTMSRAGSPTTNLTIFKGSCDQATKINVALHFLINVISTGIIACTSVPFPILRDCSSHSRSL